MRICFATPFKPLNCRTPSGDLAIATGLYRFLYSRGHDLYPICSTRTRWIFWKPWLWPRIIRDARRAMRCVGRQRVDVWLTYHSYYKAPDVIGPVVTRRMNIAYVIFQGMYSTRRNKQWYTRPGYELNTRALCAANHVLTNRKEDLDNLKRLLPAGRLTYIKPGIYPWQFSYSAGARAELRRLWDVGDAPVIISAAMFRPGVKTQGLEWVIRSCASLRDQGRNVFLVIVGDGREREKLRLLAQTYLPGRVRFAGRIDHRDMYRYYSAADMFAFPGIRESLGMVFLEAQCCGLPVVAFSNGGVPEVVSDQKTGFLVPVYDSDAYVRAMDRLIADSELRRRMGENAREYVRTHHDLEKNYQQVEDVLNRLAASGAPSGETVIDSGNPVGKGPPGWKNP